MTPPKLLTPAEAADRLSVSPMTVYRLIGCDALPAFRIGRNLRIDPRDLIDYMRAARTVPLDTGGQR